MIYFTSVPHLQTGMHTLVKNVVLNFLKNTQQKPLEVEYRHWSEYQNKEVKN